MKKSVTKANISIVVFGDERDILLSTMKSVVLSNLSHYVESVNPTSGGIDINLKQEYSVDPDFSEVAMTATGDGRREGISASDTAGEDKVKTKPEEGKAEPTPGEADDCGCLSCQLRRAGIAIAPFRVII